MDTLFWLTDRYGPRLTGTPAIDEAGAWTMKKMTDWGLANVHREDWDFGKGWSLVRFSAHMVEPQIQPLIGLPKTWSVGTARPLPPHPPPLPPPPPPPSPPPTPP